MRLVGDNDEDEDDGLDNTDLSTIEEDDTRCADDRDSDPQESPLQKKNKLSKQKNAGKAEKKGEG
jgi:hypothetical protein